LPLIRRKVSFKYKDYRLDGPERFKVMTLDTHEFIRRFLIHVLPNSFHRIRHYGACSRADNLARALLGVSPTQNEPSDSDRGEPPMPHARTAVAA
jgi:hypothetical protein